MRDRPSVLSVFRLPFPVARVPFPTHKARRLRNIPEKENRQRKLPQLQPSRKPSDANCQTQTRHLLRSSMRQSPREDALHGRELGVSDLGQRHLVKWRPEAVAQLGPEIAPVHVCLLALFLQIGAARVRLAEHVAIRLLANDGNVPLWGELATVSLGTTWLLTDLYDIERDAGFGRQ